MKHLILVTSPPACGKTFVAKKLAELVRNCVYLDKDSVLPLSKQIFQVAGEEYNRSSAFFEREVRDYEYAAILGVALEALAYNECVILNAPFSREIRNDAYLDRLRQELEQRGARLQVVWVHTDEEVCRRRMERRNSERDVWKLTHWAEYVKGRNFAPPANIPDLAVVENSTPDSHRAGVLALARMVLSHRA
jgi:predicted kinase